MAHVLYGRPSDRHRAPARSRHVLPKIYNIEMDPHEDLQVGALFGWTAGPPLEVVEKYKETLKKYPNPPAGNLTRF